MSQFAAMPSYNQVQSSQYAVSAMGTSPNGSMHAQNAPPGQVQYRAQGYNFQHAPQTPQPDSGNVHMANLAQAFGGVSLNGLQSLHPGRATSPAMASPHIGLPHLVGAQPTDPLYFLPDGRIMVPGMQSPQPPFQQAPAPFKAAPHYLPQITLQSYVPGQPMLPAFPPPPTWSLHPTAKDVPELTEPRRTSLSSNEENVPGTPYLGAVSYADFQPGIAITDRSLSGGLSYGTPSTQPMSQTYVPLQLGKGSDGQYTYLDLDALTQQEPAIPRAVPAPWSSNSQRTLDKALKNEFGITNVYIRGLLPDTTDDMLHSYAVRFGEIISCKAILDLETGLCKGFGFVNFHNYVQCENCIRGFFHLGYEVSFARESHNSRLKTLSDPGNTNLYVSNLPRNFNEVHLKEIFEGYKVISAKILRDSNGINRGVGFARMETHEICEEVIAKYHGKPIGEDGSKLQIRYADTDEQKKLKNLTTERRQFKAHEYNAVVFGGTSPYQYPSPTSDGFPQSFTPHLQGAQGVWMTGRSLSPSTASQSPLMGSGMHPNIAIPAYAVPMLGRPTPRETYIVESPGVTVANTRIAQEKPTSKIVPTTPEHKSKVANSTAQGTVLGDVSCSITSSV